MPDLTEIASSIRNTRTPFREVENKIPSDPGLYGIFLDSSAGVNLTSIANHPLDQPAYVGKAKKGLKRRHLGEHFATGKTGSSTVRRSFAALLRPDLDLHPIRRGNTGKDQDFVSYKLDRVSDELLSAWMTSHLEIGWWAFTGQVDQLKRLEHSLIAHFQPPLNLQHSSHPAAAPVKSLRAECADLARKTAA